MHVAPLTLLDGIVVVFHSVESTGCASLDVGDLIVKHLNRTFQRFKTDSKWCLV